MERRITAHVDLEGTPVRCGDLFMRVRRGRETSSFRYDAQWLSHPARFALDPNGLPLTQGTFSLPDRLFPGISDSAPDRWGRTLIQRAHRRSAAARTLFEADYLLGVHDLARQGALRFSIDDGPFLADGPPIPPLVRLGELLGASDAVQADPDDVDALRLMLAPGSSLGGARPKASVWDDGLRGRAATGCRARSSTTTSTSPGRGEPEDSTR